MKTHELMRTGEDCPTVSDTATLDLCYETILAAPRRAGAAGIVDGDGKLVGIITHGDFFRLFKNGDHGTGRSVAEVMTRNPKRIGRDDRVVDAIALMQQYSIDELPIVDERDRLVGLIDIQDLIARGFSLANAS